MRMTQAAFLVVLLALLAAGCVSRTTARPRKLAEIANRVQSTEDEHGYVVHSRLIWIWQSEFWNP